MNRCLAVKIKGVYEDFVDQHEKLLKALIVKDKDRAEEIMKVHIEVGKQCALKILNEIG